jgi:hypothetical protein
VSIPAAHIDAIILGGVPGSGRSNPINVNIVGPDPYTIAILTPVFAVLAAIIGSTIAYVLANRAQESRDRIHQLNTDKDSCLEVERRLWAFSAGTDNIIQQLNRVELIAGGAVSDRLLKSFDAYGILLLAAGTGFDFPVLQPLIGDAYALSEAIDSYRGNPAYDTLASLKKAAADARRDLGAAQETAFRLRTQTQEDLDKIETRIRARPKRSLWGLGPLGN